MIATNSSRIAVRLALVLVRYRYLIAATSSTRAPMLIRLAMPPLRPACPLVAVAGEAQRLQLRVTIPMRQCDRPAPPRSCRQTPEGALDAVEPGRPPLVPERPHIRPARIAERGHEQEDPFALAGDRQGWRKARLLSRRPAQHRNIGTALKRSRNWLLQAINTDKNPAYGKAIAELKKESMIPAGVRAPCAPARCRR